MSEAIWIELIKVLPAFLWVGFGFIALAIAKRIFTAQAPRMTKVETPWVTVELAQRAIEQAGLRGSAAQDPPPEPDWPHLYPPLPSQQVPARFSPREPVAGPDGDGMPPPRFNERDPFGAGPGGDVPPPDPASPPPLGREGGNGWGCPRTDEPLDADPQPSPPRKPQNTPPADEPTDAEPGDGAAKPDAGPPSPVTEPNRLVPNAPPTYPIIGAAPGGTGGYYAPPIPSQRYAASAPLPPYRAGPAHRAPDSQRGLRAAARLALSTDLLQGGAILWVDDHPEWNEPLIRLFRTAGMKVESVETTDEALRRLGREAYDLVITDLRRERDPGDGAAGMALLDRMVERGVPTPAVVYSDNPQARTLSHPRVAATTNDPEELVDRVVDLVAHRRNALDQSQAGRLGGFFGKR